MKTNLSIPAFSVAVVAFALAFTISAQPTQPVAGTPSSLSPTELAERALERRAVEAIIWGMPAVNFDLMYQAMIRDAKAGAGSNKVVYWSKLSDWKNQTLTPNPDAVYFMPFFDTKDVGPVVLEIPPADERIDHGLGHGLLAGGIGGRRHRWGRQGQGRQVPYPAA